jgi:acetate kinase
MNVLVLNGGSSSIKFSVFAVDGKNTEPRLLLDGSLSRRSEQQGTLELAYIDGPAEKHDVQGVSSNAAAIGVVLDAVQSVAWETIQAVGYRVVHPGPYIHDHVLITETILRELEAAADFAPLHDPEAVAIIREAMRRTPGVPHVACFDTVFHQTMPEEASTYAIPKELRDQGVKRYGFHGLSCESILRQLRLQGALPRRMVIAHLGSGCSVTAVLDGQSIDTTMGLTPTGGLVMGTRPGDLDPGLLLYLLRQNHEADAVAAVERMLNHDSGMVALTGLPNDMRAVRQANDAGNDAVRLALKVFTRSIRKTIGSFAWLMGGLDAIVFTGGIGEHDAATRAEVLSGAEVCLDASRNAMNHAGVRLITAPHTKPAVFVVPAQEDLVIALHVMEIATSCQGSPAHKSDSA